MTSFLWHPAKTTSLLAGIARTQTHIDQSKHAKKKKHSCFSSWEDYLSSNQKASKNISLLITYFIGRFWQRRKADLISWYRYDILSPHWKARYSIVVTSKYCRLRCVISAWRILQIKTLPLLVTDTGSCSSRRDTLKVDNQKLKIEIKFQFYYLVISYSIHWSQQFLFTANFLTSSYSSEFYLRLLMYGFCVNSKNET